MALDVLQLEDFGLSPSRGFLGLGKPLAAFDNGYYAPWDALLAQLPELIQSQRLHQRVQELPILSTTKLSSDRELQRAYVALAFIIHGYVWHDGPTDKIPPQLSEPFLEVCRRIDTRPVLSYSGLCLWNWTCDEDPASDEDFPDFKHLSTLASFTGSKGEAAFYLVPVLIEAEGARLLPLLLGAVEAASRSDFTTVRSALESAATTLKTMGQHLPILFSTLDAHMFYHELRPFYAGGKGVEEKGLPRGMVFQRSDGTEEAAQCIGGSAAQSSLFPFLDYVLGVKHDEPADGKESVFQEMRAYMPGKHREFLKQVAALPSIRSFVENRPEDTKLCGAYDECLRHLRLWRGKHIAVVSKYIVQPARAEAKSQMNGHSGSKEVSDDFQAESGEQLQGTGGSALIPFLRQARDETIGISTQTK